MKPALIAFYLDWTNNYLTTEKLALDYGVSVDDAIVLIRLGKKYHEQYVAEVRS